METLALKRTIFSALGHIIIPPLIVNRLYSDKLEHRACSIDWKNFLLNLHGTQWKYLQKNISEVNWPNSGNFNLLHLRNEMISSFADLNDTENNFYLLLFRYLNHDNSISLADVQSAEQQLISSLPIQNLDNLAMRRYLTAILLTADEYYSPCIEEIIQESIAFFWDKN